MNSFLDLLWNSMSMVGRENKHQVHIIVIIKDKIYHPVRFRHFYLP